MNETLSISAERLAELFRRSQDWPEYPYKDEWTAMFESLSGTTVSCRLTEKNYILDLYRARLESASARGDNGLGGLDGAVSLLTASVESCFAFTLISWRGRGFFLWLSADASSLVASWRAIDARSDT